MEKRFNHLQFLPFFLCLLCLGCVVKLREGKDLSSFQEDLSIQSVIISSDTPLVVSSLSNSTGFTPVLGGDNPALGGLAAIGLGDFPPLGGNIPALGGSTPAMNGSTPLLDAFEHFDATTSFLANFTITVQHLDETQKVCALLSPFQSKDCSLDSMNLQSSSISSSGDFQLEAYSLKGPRQKKTKSNVLPVRSYSITQVSNTHNNNAVSDVDPDLASATKFTIYNGELYFSATNSFGSWKLFKTDGTTITQVSNTANDQNTSEYPGLFLYKMVVANNLLFFSADNRNSRSKLFSTDGSNVFQISNTRNDNTLDDHTSSFAGNDPANIHITSMGSEVYFLSNNSNSRTKVFKTDGTTVTQVSNVRNDNTLNDVPTALTAFNGHVYFVAHIQNMVSKLFKTDGTDVFQVSNTAGNNAVSDEIVTSDIASREKYTEPPLMEVNGWLYFIAANSSGGLKLFRTDGTSVIQVSNTSNNQSADDFEQYLGIFSLYSFGSDGTHLYFSGINENRVSKLFRTDGNTIVQVSNTTHDEFLDDLPSNIVSYKNEIYFFSMNQSGGIKLFKTDGTTVTQVSNTAEDQSGLDPLDLNLPKSIVYDDRLFFSARNVNGNSKLYMTDGTSIVQITDTSQSSFQDDNPTSFIIFKGELYFTANNSNGSGKVFKISKN